MTILHVAFVGLMSFFQGSSGVDGLLVSTLVPQYASYGVLIPTHDAFLAIKKALLDPDDPCPDEAGVNKKDPQVCSWMLSHHDLSFEGVEIDHSGGPVCVPDEYNTCPAPIRDLMPEHFVLKGVCRDPKPRGCPIVGRVLLPAPRIQGVELCGAPITFKPLRGTVPDDTNHKQIAELTWADLKIEGSSVKLHLDKFGSLTGGRTINLKVAGNDLSIIVANIHRKHSLETDSATPDVDRHFELFYSLAEQDPPGSQRSVPHATCSSPKQSAPPWLLDMLGDIDVSISSSKGLHERVICPMSSF